MEEKKLERGGFGLNALRIKGKQIKLLDYDAIYYEGSGNANTLGLKLTKNTIPVPVSMVNAVTALAPYLADVFYFNDVAALGKEGKALAEKVAARIRVHEVVVGGKGEEQNLKIKGFISLENGQEIKIGSHAIDLNASTYGWESKLAEALEKIEDEAYAYATSTEDAQLSMAGALFDKGTEEAGA